VPAGGIGRAQPVRDALTRARAMLAPVAAAVAAAAGFAVVAVVDPNEPGNYPPCPLYALTGLYCPGCGALRAAHALAHADVGAALGLNALLVALIPVAAAVWARWAVRSWQGRPIAIKAPPPAIVWAFLILVISYGVIRNLPIGHFLAP
jgi:hypothetical protein